jgi:hypothetical protein
MENSSFTSTADIATPMRRIFRMRGRSASYFVLHPARRDRFRAYPVGRIGGVNSQGESETVCGERESRIVIVKCTPNKKLDQKNSYMPRAGCDPIDSGRCDRSLLCRGFIDQPEFA